MEEAKYRFLPIVDYMIVGKVVVEVVRLIGKVPG
ncbi:hypothetical protein FA11_0941 [Pelosinus fermentans A11]|uniref:Uncharacterized protein n=1 Tax=Pelosinus fermentans B4 TaxID=1149862 RepID=I9LHE6_9FIRM|nr:hypothetical protein FB4_0180 [Pelosinus fermentans B4]EIW21214.1 hypothetical protein FA11_0941 [Pelosinus fermentans A11]